MRDANAVEAEAGSIWARLGRRESRQAGSGSSDWPSFAARRSAPDHSMDNYDAHAGSTAFIVCRDAATVEMCQLSAVQCQAELKLCTRQRVLLVQL